MIVQMKKNISIIPMNQNLHAEYQQEKKKQRLGRIERYQTSPGKHQ